MSLTIFLNISSSQQRLCLKKNQKIEAFRFFAPRHQKGYGACFWGKVVRVNPSFGFAFLDINEDQLALVPLLEKNFPPLCEGDVVLVQVVREAFAAQGKGMKVSRNLAFKSGPFTYRPFGQRILFSKQLSPLDKKELRKSLRRPVGSLEKGQQGGWWVSDKAVNYRPESLLFHMKNAKNSAPGLDQHFSKNSPKGCIAPAPSLLDWVRQEFVGLKEEASLFLDDATAFGSLKKGLTAEEISFLPRVFLLSQNVFDEEMEEAWELLSKNRLPLPTGGSLVIEETEALTSFDINTGGAFISSSFQANLGAIPEIFRQIRLKHLSGILIIDFIAMNAPQDRLHIERKMRIEAQNQQVRGIDFFGFSRLRLFEMTRSRKGPSLMAQLKCKG